ncbi:carbohydrate porin [Schlesneria paludicola]|uniref:carbohydrate porin n=1 Tax=Schlesneria paludicola TaxID=360056 RepID=UPI0003177BB7|nr:carbohydrate porin [Schlesneria paludicola]
MPCLTSFTLDVSKTFGSAAAILSSLFAASSLLAQDSAPVPPLTGNGTSAVVSADGAELPAPIFAPQPAPAPSPYAGSLWERPFLLGDVGGWRDEAASDGFTFNVSTTQFYQGVASGGIQRNFAYSGRNDYLVNIDGEKAGLWKGLFITMHGETRYGETINASTGAIMPANVGMLFPTTSGSSTALTGVKITQALSEEFVVFGGKINTLDGLTQTYAGGRGVDAFMNMGLAFPLVAARTVPYSSLGAGFAVLHEMQPVFSFMVLDTKNSPTTTGFEDFLQNGVTMLSQLQVPVTLMGRPGHQGITGTYSTGTYSDLTPTAYFDPNVGPVITTGTTSGSWCVFYSADQALYVDPCNPKRSWGLFTNIGLADNGPSPIRWSANIGLGGSSPIVSRPLDTFGIGYSYVGYSGPVKDLAPVLLPIRDDRAVELYYNYAVTPWFRLTPDLQILVPAREQTLPPGAQSINTAIVVGMRAKIDF